MNDINKLIKANKELLEAVKIQQEMMDDLRKYVDKQDKAIMDLIDGLILIWN